MAVLDHREGLGGSGGRPEVTRRRTRGATNRAGDVQVIRTLPRWQRRYVFRCLTADFLAGVVAGWFAFFVHSFPPEARAPWVAAASLPLVWVLVLTVNRAYESRFLGVGSEEFRRVARAGVGLIAVIALAAYATGQTRLRWFVLIALPLVTVLTLADRYGLRRWLHARRERDECLHRVVVVGHEGPVLDIVRRLGSAKYHGLKVVAACLPIPGQRPSLMEHGVPVVGGFGSVAQAVRLTEADTVAVLASPDLGPEQLRRLAWDLEPTGADLLVAPSLVEVAGPRLSIRPVTGLPLLQVEQPQFSGGRRIVKDVFDRGCAIAGVVLLAPILLGIAVAIRITSHGPALFRQQRIGKDGRPFTMVKFRSMVVDAESLRAELHDRSDRDGPMFKMHEDPRVTRVGRWLRRYSLDELPQLFNVVGGSMSLVGPRPPLPSEVLQYGDDVRRRLLVRPGVTGLWQVSGRSDLSWEESVTLDLRYVDNWSMAADLLILWKTARAVLGGSGAY